MAIFKLFLEKRNAFFSANRNDLRTQLRCILIVFKILSQINGRNSIREIYIAIEIHIVLACKCFFSC